MTNFTIECVACSCRREPTQTLWPNGQGKAVRASFCCRCCKTQIPIVCRRCGSRFTRATFHLFSSGPSQETHYLYVSCESCGNEEGSSIRKMKAKTPTTGEGD